MWDYTKDMKTEIKSEIEEPGFLIILILEFTVMRPPILLQIYILEGGVIRVESFQDCLT